ncbi:unnamed protein product [Vitrella brassicaformis CCMP3155]|uniref:FCP1 homology domain-containing protein n=1 Tax=Vitrella brassicaformis (strain CCMP3155) TaxID=1169540 RepID=A0A0G4FH11_VITBC|nr:unnamed protein product [Vitrella brassicaformis CCMP3155]|mmetsp:Transcript_15585/g.37171  ORF Transcript_15585/g.37171 Transcript_15585/m.37171 type:complete len:244 (-) Transcript_15585:2290-3021(-)|eukprot:CEM12750.1 unnamed protein product [Vitrella brassicaformis CCMP3155]
MGTWSRSASSIPLKSVIVDLDGCLLDSEPLWWLAEIEGFGKVGRILTEEDCRETTGLRIDEIVELRYAEQPWDEAATGITRRALRDLILSLMVKHIQESGHPMKGMKDALDFAKSKKVLMAICSSSAMPLIEAAVDRLGIRGYFDVLTSAGDLQHGKPHPEVYLNCAKALGVHPTQCVAIEDSLNGVLAAKAARMRCVAVPDVRHGGEVDKRFVIADVVLEHLGEFDQSVWDRLCPSDVERGG